MMGLSDGRKIFPIGLAVLIQYRRVTATHPASQPASQPPSQPRRCSYYALTLKASSAKTVLFPCNVLTSCVGGRQNMPLQVDLERGVRVTCDVGYLCANVGLPRPLCSRVRPDVRDRHIRQTDVRQKHRLMPPPIRGGEGA